MKCPKCGYVSFNYLEQCKKCGKDLVLFKEEKHLWAIKPGNLKLSSLPSEASPFESMALSADEGIGAAIITEAAEDEPSPILEESVQEVANDIEAIETLPEKPEGLKETLETGIEAEEETALPLEGEEEIVLEEELVGLDIPISSEDEKDEEPEILGLGVSAEPEEDSGPSLLLDEMEQDIQIDLEAEEEPIVLPLEEPDEATEEPIILLEEKDQPEDEEEEILLDLGGSEDSTDELGLLLDEDEEETK
jgi:hypothetical protein